MTDEEYNTAINEFMQGYYGDGWKYMRKYIDSLTNSGNKKGHFGIGEDEFDLLDRSDIHNNSTELNE